MFHEEQAFYGAGYAVVAGTGKGSGDVWVQFAPTQMRLGEGADSVTLTADGQSTTLTSEQFFKRVAKLKGSVN
jgi:hypothetical protein